ncbi:MAG: Rieske 2Fe-2S domain-containing protein [Verrucomicrobia bacterium]|nr:Rieske 2Fe-2S domain-containing protein [Verrucomicrobiota bacterium]
MQENRLPEMSARRGFFKKASAVVIGALAGIVPGLSALFVFLDPLRRKTNAGESVMVASLSALPEDGVPRKFSVVTSHTDAWTRNPDVPIGAVYLRRTGQKTVQAFNVVCPHAGCFVGYKVDRKSYHCPCHNSTFALDGRINDPKSPSPRGLDELPVEIRNEVEIWVKFQNFRAGHAEKIPVS